MNRSVVFNSFRMENLSKADQIPGILEFTGLPPWNSTLLGKAWRFTSRLDIKWNSPIDSTGQ